MTQPRDDQPQPDSRRPAVIGLLLVLALVVVGYFLFDALRENAKLVRAQELRPDRRAGAATLGREV